MAENLDSLNTAVSLLIRAALLAARSSGRVRHRRLKRLSLPEVLVPSRWINGTSNPASELWERAGPLLSPSGSSGRLDTNGSDASRSSRDLTIWRFCAPNSKVGTTLGARI